MNDHLMLLGTLLMVGLFWFLISIFELTYLIESQKIYKKKIK